MDTNSRIRPAIEARHALIEPVVSIAIAVLAATELAFRQICAGPLWRDEISAFNLATAPSLAQVWKLLPNESFPLVWFIILRGWAALGFARTDAGIRCLGFIVGLAVVSSVWIAARQMGLRYPIVAPALLCGNPAFMAWIGANRAYGLGTAAIVLTTGVAWTTAKRGGRLELVRLAILCAISVQTLYFNAACLCAILPAAALVAFARGRPARAAGVLGAGIVAGLTLIPYLRVYRIQAVVAKIQPPASLSYVLASVKHAVAPTDLSMYLWILLLVVTVFAASMHARLQLDSSERPPWSVDRSSAPFAAITTVLMFVVFVVGMYHARSGLYERYFVPPIAVAAVCLEIGLRSVTPRPARPLAVSLIALLALGFGAAKTIEAVTERQTNVDLVAHEVAGAARPGDTIVLVPWLLQLPFSRYYNGTAPWQTLPAVSDSRFEGFMMLLPPMTQRHPIDAILASVDRTLDSGHTVYFVGEASNPPPRVAPVELPPAPGYHGSWDHLKYEQNWRDLVWWHAKSHASGDKTILLTDNRRIFDSERIPLTIYRGKPQKN